MDSYDATMYAMGQLNSALINAGNVALASGSKKQDRKFAREMYAKQVEDNRENWRMMNDYNSPSAQMERLQAAGLNPNLIYGSGGVTGTTSLPSSSSQGASYSQPPRMEQLHSFTDYMQLRQFQRMEELQDAQIDKMNAEKSLIYANAAKVEEETKNQEFLNQLNLDTRHWTIESKEIAVQILRNDLATSSSKASMAKNQADLDNWWYKEGFAKAESLLRLKGMRSGIAEASARIKQLGALAVSLQSQANLNKKLTEIYNAGFSPNDGKFWHAIGDFISTQTGGKSIGKAMSDWFDKLLSGDWFLDIFGDSGYYNGY